MCWLCNCISQVMCYIKWCFSSNFILLGASVSNLTTMFPISHVLFLVWNDPLLLCQSTNLSLQKPQLVRIMSYNTDKSLNEAWYYFKIDVTILQDFNINFTVVSGLVNLNFCQFCYYKLPTNKSFNQSNSVTATLLALSLRVTFHFSFIRIFCKEY